jgi:excisionase family DNA binding protein
MANMQSDRNDQHHEDDLNRLLTPPELGELLGIPTATLYQWRHRGEGPPSLKLGKHLRYRRADVDSWLDDMGGTRAG